MKDGEELSNLVTFAAWEDEDHFRDSLAKYIKEGFIWEYRNHDNSLITAVKVNKEYPPGSSNRPDILVYHKGIDLYYSKLSNPFFIECKIDSKEMRKNLLQGLRYKYSEGDSTDFTKRGDYHVVYAIPEYIRNYPTQNFKKQFPNHAQLVRTLWQLGMGIITTQKARFKLYHKEKECLKVEFNEQEEFIIGERE